MDSESTERRTSDSHASNPAINTVDETLSTAWMPQDRRSSPPEASSRPSPSPNTLTSNASFSSPQNDVSDVIVTSPISVAPVEPLQHAVSRARTDIGSQYHPSVRCWPFVEPIEVVLFQHFKQKLSLFFDLCDPHWHFATHVPSRARQYAPLMDAIFALSARHMSLAGNEINPDLAAHYYQRCLRVLILELDTVQQDRLDDLLAATIILRLHEELDGPFADWNTYRHSMGTRALLQSQEAQAATLTGVRRAAAWAGMRQEIYGSIKLHRAPAIMPSSKMLNHMRSSSEDNAWADSAVAHCLEVVDFCFGENKNNEGMYDALLGYNEQWTDERPMSYDPLCFHVQESSGGGEAQHWNVRYHADWHGTKSAMSYMLVLPNHPTDSEDTVAIGWSYRSLARILLVIHNPRQPRVGLNRIPAWDEVLTEVNNTMKLLCSIARCRANVPGPSLIACMAIWLAGDMIDDAVERKQVLQLLDATEADHGWPTQDIRAELTRLWGP